MNLRRRTIPSFAILLCCALADRAPAQEVFANFETPQTHPIELATVGDVELVLVVNTPDNSVEIYEAAPPHAFVQRVRVGLGPVTVRWNAARGRFYTCNFDGDSISVVRLVQAPGGAVRAVLERTHSFFVGDEPSDLGFSPDNAVLAATLSSSSSLTLLNAADLSFAGGQALLEVTDPVSSLAFAVKMPRSMAWLPDGRFFVTNLRAGSPDPASALPQYDVGLYRFDPQSPGGPPDFTGGLGSTNHAFAVTSDGERMFVVGTKAQNHGNVGVQAVSQVATGFVQSWLMVVDVPPAGAMNVRAEAPVATVPAPPLPSVNLNRDYSAPGVVEVATDDALVQPTGVALIENENGEVTEILVAAFHSDRVAVLSPNTGVAGGYQIRRLDVPVLSPGSSYTVSGPRGIVYSQRHGLAYTNGRLDNTLAVIDPAAGTVTARRQLRNDPTPAVIRAGRQFLYSNRFSIDDSQPVKTGGFVSCAVCHVDGRTDGLPWDLGVLTAGPAVPASFHDQNGQTTATMPLFPEEKGPLVTQTLQGLVNYEVNEAFQIVATNAPYHWRGDKADFTDFNEAFVNLQGMDNISTPGDPKGVTDPEMVQYRRFINTIRHPPNPEQDLFRTAPGTLDPDFPNDPTLATEVKLGLQLYHDVAVVGHRSCVDCHHLPDGSSNTATLTFLGNRTISGGPAQLHPIETAALRNIAQREMALNTGFTDVITHFTANAGLLHSGSPLLQVSLSINRFVHGTFKGQMPGPNVDQQIEALTRFVRELDTGTAPLAGFGYTVDPSLSPLNSGLNRITFDSLEGQVKEANVGLAVYTRHNGTVKGYWYDITGSSPAYREEGTASFLNRDQVLALAAGADNVVIAQATPLGGERRWANALGVATLISDTSKPPANVTLEPMAPNTAFVDVPKFNQNLNLGAPPTSSIWTQRTLQTSVAGLGFGVPAVRHEPPRRFRVTADDIRAGATLLFAMAAGQNPASTPIQIMEMKLYPTRHMAGNRRIWETRVELDATQTFALLNGGYWAPDVANVLLRTTASPSLKPLMWNQFLAAVVNEDQTIGFNLNNWQVLKVQDTR